MPVYAYECETCDEVHTFTELRPMKDYDKPAFCPVSGAEGRKLIEVPNIMNTALPDGTRRFDKVREYRKLEDQKRANVRNKAERQRAEAEIKKLLKE